MLDAASQSVFDVAIVGGGINGACLYHHLCQAGYRVLLMEKGDFASGTSQASAMMIWGGLLYLANNWDVFTTRKLCAARDRMVRDLGDWVKPLRVRILPSPNGGRSQLASLGGLYLYWLLGGCHRQRPCVERAYPEKEFLCSQEFRDSLVYEEAWVFPSDSRFVCKWILPHLDADHIPLNRCALKGGGYDGASRLWKLEMADTLSRKELVGGARCVVNTAGVWTDAINRTFGLESPYRHLFSKEVFIGMRRDRRHRTPLVFENPHSKELDSFALLPWGPVSLWGPTETPCDDLEAGYRVEPRDVEILLRELNRYLLEPIGPQDVVSLRGGVRSLVVDRSHPGSDSTVTLSRRTEIHKHPELPWISVYGGKLTGCAMVAHR